MDKVTDAYMDKVLLLYKCYLNGDSMRLASRRVGMTYYSTRVMFNVWKREKIVID
ncbi:hypothetical protein LCGC14_1086710 [marine sediment metagenome]|uniref:Uncharacterized protein n=1 Tax=marine sediment metagenome TaxID=412755 RepID=A0A0F9MDS6_9ZZZZ